MDDEDFVVDLLSADDIVAVAVDLVIGDFVVDVDVSVVVNENGATRVFEIVPIIVVADEIMLDEYVNDDCVIFVASWADEVESCPVISEDAAPDIAVTAPVVASLKVDAAELDASWDDEVESCPVISENASPDIAVTAPVVA